MRPRRFIADQVLHMGPRVDDPDRSWVSLPRHASVDCLAPVFSDSHRPTSPSGHTRHSSSGSPGKHRYPLWTVPEGLIVVGVGVTGQRLR